MYLVLRVRVDVDDRLRTMRTAVRTVRKEVTTQADTARGRELPRREFTATGWG